MCASGGWLVTASSGGSAERRVPPERLQHFVAAVARAEGVPGDQAETFAARMVEADLRGMHGHGVVRLAPYVRRMREGGYTLRPKIRALRETPVSALVEGDNGLGQVVMTFAVETAIAKARESGLAWVGVRGGNHAGAGGVYAAMALPHDLAGVYLAVGNANHMAPWGGLDALLSTNPIAIAIPAGEETPFVLDMATSMTSYGKVKVYAQRGEPLPAGWMVGPDGRALTDSRRAGEGLLLPVGGHKGSGLSMMVGMLAGVMNGAAFGSAVIDFNADYTSATNTGQAYLALRPDLFRDLPEFKAEMDLRLRELRASRPAPGEGAVRVPGEMAAAREAEMRAQGIPVAAGVLRSLRELADEHDLDPLEASA